MATTNFGLLTNEQKTIWSTDMWSQARNLSFINKFLGKDENSVIQHVTDLTKTQRGARAVKPRSSCCWKLSTFTTTPAMS